MGGVTPQWTAPIGLSDPFIRRWHVNRGTWTSAIRGHVALRDAAVALTLAGYGNADGTNCHPGIMRLAEDLGSSPSTIKRSLAWLDEHGWISRTARGSRKLGHADTYQVSIPAPYAVTAGWWPDDDSPQWMERPSQRPNRPFLQVTRDPLER